LRHRLARFVRLRGGAARAMQHGRFAVRAARIGTIAALRLLRRITARRRGCRRHPALQ
jgi:hypothetical protein